jgi:dipeptidase E
MKIVLTSCGIINEDVREKFFALSDKAPEELRILYITTAVDGESGDKSWVGEEFATILDLGIRKENIVEYKIGEPDVNLEDFDAIYMMGGNSFYLAKKMYEYDFGTPLKKALEAGVVYIGSSAGAIVAGVTLAPAAVYGDEPVDNKDYPCLNLVDAAIFPHANKRAKEYADWLKGWSGRAILLKNGEGVVIEK